MEIKNQQDNAAEYMRLAVPLMTKYGIAMTPHNYTVWFEYVSGSNLQLCETIDTKLAAEGTFSSEHTQELYNAYFGPDKEEITLLDKRADLRRLLEEIHNFAKSGVDSASTSTAQLADALSELNLDLSKEQIQDVISDVMTETKQAMTSSQLLTDRLNSAIADIETLKTNIEESKRESKIDRLTGLANRKAFDEQIQNQIKQSEQSKEDLTVVFCDLDLFTDLNAKHGHLVGDQVLKVVANMIKSAVKGRDHVARYNGVQFTITLANTSLQHAKNIAESVRNEIASKRIQRKDSKEPLGQITMSFGVAEYCHLEGPESLLQRAERALYQSKRKGRNRVSEANPPIM